MSKLTQNERVLQHMQIFGSITQEEASERYGITRLGARIYDLKKEGEQIVKSIETGKNRFGEPTHYARYTMKN